jgi:EAL domain-containing protein (putative c-di-GMP-specific phosphodiesterase class I)
MEGRVLQSALRYADARGLTIAGILAKPYSRDQLRNLLELGLNATAPTNTPLSAPVLEEPETPERTILKALRSALHHHEVNLAIQPKVACATGVVVGFEALARWNRPGFGPVSPGIFVPIAERNGLAAELTETIGLQALTWFRESHQSTDRYMALNVSATEVGDADLDVHLMSLCKRTGVEPANVTIEITETAAMADPVTSLERLTRLRLEGFRLSMDDFGTGYSSMRELVRLPFSELKIDQGFVTTAAESHQSTAVVRSIIELAHSLGMTCTAEGVEDTATMDLLVSLECDVAQGFHLGLPMAPAGLAIWLENVAAATGAPQP